MAPRIDSGDDGAIGLPPQPSYHHHTTSMSDFGTGSGPSIQFTPERSPRSLIASPLARSRNRVSGSIFLPNIGEVRAARRPENEYEEGDSVSNLSTTTTPRRSSVSNGQEYQPVAEKPEAIQEQMTTEEALAQQIIAKTAPPDCKSRSRTD